METITSASVTAWLHNHYRPLHPDLDALRQTAEADGIPIILPETEMALQPLLLVRQPSRILEIGTAIGYSALFFAHLCPQAEIYTVERDEQAWQAACANLEAAGVSDRVHVLLGDGETQIHRLRDQGVRGFQFVFIDAAKSHYRRFLDAALEVCADGALLVSDNVLQRGTTLFAGDMPPRKHRTNILNMQAYIAYICQCPALITSLLSVGDGMAVSVYRGTDGSTTL